MGLVDLKTNLKSLKYGQETPLVTKDINNPSSNNTLSMEVTRRVDDTVRIVKLLATKPGLSWIAKQGALEIVQQSIHSDGKEELLKRLAEAGLNTAKVIGSTIAQVPVNGTGTHFIRGFGGKKGYIQRSGAPLAKEGKIIADFDIESKLTFPDGSPVSKASSATFASTGSLFYNRSTSPSLPAQDQDGNGFIDDAELNLPDTPKVLGISQILTHPTNIRKESRVNLGDQSIRKSRVDYTDTSEDLSDGINALAPTSNYVKMEDGSRDLIKFNFELVTPTSGGKTSSNYLYFRALLDSLSDNYSGNWSGHKYIGRAENFHTYGGFERNISLSFKIAAATRQEMKPLYQKIVMLASATAPTYDTGTFMKGTIVGLTVGDYVHKTYGILTSVNYNWQTEYPWEIAMNNPEGNADDDQQELPMVLDCSINFTPIHDFIPQTGLYHYITSNYTQEGKTKFFTPGEKIK